jgi:hypothetical protein
MLRLCDKVYPLAPQERTLVSLNKYKFSLRVIYDIILDKFMHYSKFVQHWSILKLSKGF